METRRVAILGTGRVGRTLGSGLAERGHEVVFGSRDPDGGHAQEAVAVVGHGARADDHASAVSSADWVFVCVPGEEAVEMIAPIAEALAGKLVVDVTNAMTQRGECWTLAFGIDDSVAQRIQKAAPDARVVKAFNTVGARRMVDPEVECAPPTMPICGDDADAKAQVSELLRDFGWEPMDFGGVACASVVEAATVVWMHACLSTGDWGTALKYVR